MNADAVSAGVMAPRPAWLTLTWIVAFTTLWTWLIYALPALPESGFPALGVRLMVHGFIALGLWLGLEGTALIPRQRQATWLAVMVPFTLWAAVAWTAAINGAFRAGASSLPLLPAAILLPVIVGTPVLLLSKRVGQLLDAMPMTWLIALQVYRVLWQPMARLLAVGGDAGPMGAAGRNWRCADRPVRGTGGDCRGDRNGRGSKSGDALEHLRPR
ncbi:hypothetical protein [Bradyrhizobium sp. LB13.1]